MMLTCSTLTDNRFTKVELVANYLNGQTNGGPTAVTYDPDARFAVRDGKHSVQLDALGCIRALFQPPLHVSIMSQTSFNKIALEQDALWRTLDHTYQYPLVYPENVERLGFCLLEQMTRLQFLEQHHIVNEHLI